MIAKGLGKNRCARKSFRIRRSEGLTEVLIVKELRNREMDGLRRQDGGSFLLRDELKTKYNTFLLIVKCYF